MPHPARFPVELPEFFIRMLTDRGDFVLDPFGGSCVTGEAAERLLRRWICCEIVEDYMKGALGRFQPKPPFRYDLLRRPSGEEAEFYKAHKPGLIQNGDEYDPLPADGGAKRPVSKSKANRALAHPQTQPFAQQLALMETSSSKRRRKRK